MSELTKPSHGARCRPAVGAQRGVAAPDGAVPAADGRGRGRRGLPSRRKLRAVLATALVGASALGLATLRQPEASAVAGPTAQFSFNDSVGRIRNSKGQTCTATVIKPFLLLSAKHCALDENATVTFFEYSGGTRKPITGKIRQVREHPTIDVVMSKVFFDSTADLPSTSEVNFDIQQNDTAIRLLGYGFTDREGNGENLATKQIEGVGRLNVFSDEPYDVVGFKTCGGDSGGPVLNASGQVVGVLVTRSSTPDVKCADTGQALKTSDLKDFIERTRRELA